MMQPQQHAVQPNVWSCLPTALAIVLGVPVQEIFDYLGHDGSQIFWPDLDDPWRRRSFHMQEMVDYCLSQNYALTMVSPYLGLASKDADDVKIIENKLMDHCTKYYNGILTGTVVGGLPHAIAWRGGVAIDPASGLQLVTQIMIEKFHIVQRTM